MVTTDDIVKINLTGQEIKETIQKSLDKIDISSFDNLRERHPNVQFDCLLRGYIWRICYE